MRAKTSWDSVDHAADHPVGFDSSIEVALRNDRELSSADWLGLAPGFRGELAELARRVPGNPAYPFLSSPSNAKNGSISDWNWMVVDDFDRRLLPQILEVFESESSVLDLGAAAALQAITALGQPQAWLTKTEPLIATHGDLRIGVFNWTTNRDAFVRALLGDPVPARPRYLREGLTIPVELAGDLWTSQEAAGFLPGDASELFGLSHDAALSAAAELMPVLRRITGPGPGANLLEAVLSVDATAFAKSPIGRMLLPLARGAPHWRNPPVTTEWAGAFDLGVVGCLGLALWAPGPVEMRKHRREMAAHVRYLFDHHASPWNRWDDERRRREGLILYWRRLPRLLGQRVPTVQELAMILRYARPLNYNQESETSTIRRLYRISASLRPAEGGLSRKRQEASPY